LIPSALHTVQQYVNNPIESDHGRLKARLRRMRGLKRHRSARILTAGHAFAQDLRRGHYDIATEVPGRHRLGVGLITVQAAGPGCLGQIRVICKGQARSRHAPVMAPSSHAVLSRGTSLATRRC
jgi:DDE domain